jgi:hypothetical protein
MDTISDYLAFSQIPESGRPSTLLCISQVLLLSNNNISFNISRMFVRVLPNLCGSAAHLFEDSTILTSCTVLPLTLLQETIFFKTHRSKQQTVLLWCSDRGISNIFEITLTK